MKLLGDPKKPRKKYDAPRNPWQSDQLSQELFLVGTYGLRNKHELWKAQTQLSTIRKQARIALAETAEERAKKESILVKSLSRIGLIESESSLDDILKQKAAAEAKIREEEKKFLTLDGGAQVLKQALEIAALRDKGAQI